jgi:hypothetical protein
MTNTRFLRSLLASGKFRYRAFCGARHAKTFAVVWVKKTNFFFSLKLSIGFYLLNPRLVRGG